MRVDAIFIGIEVDDEVAKDTEVAAKLTEVCPVDIYAQNDDGTLHIVEKNVDECVLCELCLDASPPGSVKVLKLYADGAALRE
jgi:NAD-dependent dihydropyrimidine dehydrogenase PreA subunit